MNKYTKRVLRCAVIPVQMLIGIVIMLAANIVGKFDNEDVILNIDIN